MTMYEQNREYVLRGLALREAKRNEEAARKRTAEQEAALDAAERDMHREINFQSTWTGIEKGVTQAAEERDKQTADKRAARRKWEKNKYARVLADLRCVGLALAIGAALHFLCSVDAISLWIELTGLSLASAYLAVMFAVHVNRIRRRKERNHG